MTSRLDRLLLLLDTGSSSATRIHAAKQIAQLAAKSVISDVAVEEDVKSRPHHAPVGDPAAWAELMAVIARILPYLHSKSHDTRTAAASVISHICTLVPVWAPSPAVKSEDDMPDIVPSPPDFPTFSVRDLMAKGTLLLGSSGKEYIKPTSILANSAEVKKARKAAMSRLGLDFLDAVADDAEDGMDWDKELAAGADDGADGVTVKKEEDLLSPTSASTDTTMKDPPMEGTKSVTPGSTPGPSTTPPPEPEQDLTGLSARERNRLKRKRKPGNSAFVAAPPPPPQGAKYTAAPAGPTGNKARLIEATDDDSTNVSRVSTPNPATNGAADTNASATSKVVVDPSKGGAVSPKAAQQSKALEVALGTWVWDGLVKLLTVDLFSAAWEVRHGAAMALRELLKIQGEHGGMKDGLSDAENAVQHARWCNDLAASCLCVFVLDRFGDFVSDQVIAPVRETVSQTLASLFLHMPRRSVRAVHDILLQMIRQDFPLPPPAAVTNGGRVGRRRQGGHVWEVRHAGLLGISYEVGVRSDLIESAGEVKAEEGETEDAKRLLRDVVDAAILGLGDEDDDVRSVAASCLVPVAQYVVQQLPEALPQIMGVLWSCLGGMKDDLSSSVGAVMDLLGKLVAYDAVIAILADANISDSMTDLAPKLFPFFRHTIPNVRLAVVKTLQTFMTIGSLSQEWIDARLMRLLMQNLVVEERADVRDATLVAWRTSVRVVCGDAARAAAVVVQPLILGWYAMVMTPLAMAMDTTAFFHASLNEEGGGERHNVDKAMLAQDLSLVSEDTIWKARLAGATALAYLLAHWPAEAPAIEETFGPILLHYVDSPSMLQKLLAGVVTEEWARAVGGLGGAPLVERSTLAREISGRTLGFLLGAPPLAYHEMGFALARLHQECFALLHAFAQDCKVPISAIPTLGTDIDVVGDKRDGFRIQTAREAIGPMFTRLKESLGRTKKKELAVLVERRAKIAADVERYLEVKTQHDVRVSAAFAATFIALKTTPEKVSPVVKGIMSGIKSEPNLDLQTRSAIAVAAFVEFCAQNKLTQPPEKIVKNLCTFLCQDTERTPTFAYTRKHVDGILSFQEFSATKATAAATNGKAKPEPAAATTAVAAASTPSEQAAFALSRRGASLAFGQLSARFAGTLLDIVPGMWHSMAGGLLSTCDTDKPSHADSLMSKQYGQDVIDSLSVLEAVVPTLDEVLWPKVVTLFPMIVIALRSQYAIVRQAASRCFATICDVMTLDGMRYVIENVLSFLGDALVLSNRQGSMELIYHIVQKLDIKALPYVIFMIVPVLGRMSDLDNDVRATATNTFASLVKMVPLEAGLPDPPGFSEELMKRRDTERQFLTQLLDGKKVEPYQLPVPIKAELRSYQQEGLNWLAFLAKFQLHGILCDDMGLGKTLQSICILASKHHERVKRHEETDSPDSVHLPSLIVCPPTLTGHWYYEILKYSENLKPVMYTGNSRERGKLYGKLKKYDVVITSYEVVRNDVANLEKIDWHYCILDEGHVIKNAKTKLTKAVKCMRAQHRLILSGTPIQNNVLELWSLFDFLMPGFLGTEQSFSERFSKPILANRDGKSKNGEAAALALDALHKQVLPFLLRRLKEDVLHDLPPKIIQDYYCELSDLQKHLYDDFGQSSARSEAEQAVQAANGEGGKSQQHVFQSLQYLRKLCNHPALVLKNDTKAIKAALDKIGAKKEANSLSDIHHAPKLLALKQLLTDCGIGGVPGGSDADKTEALSTEAAPGAFSQHRALIFCQMKQMLDIIETDLFKQLMPSVTYMRLDGSTDPNKRHAVVQTFNSDPSIDCLLLTTHVGGLGLTLTGADTVIFVEHDWNPMKDLQAMDRAHRIGQKKVVNVYRLITKGTLEEKIMGLQRFKLNIANSVVTQQNSGLSSMDTDLVLDLFRRTTEEEDAAVAAKEKERQANKSASQKNVLHGLEDLPPEEEYEGLDLSSFMSSIKR